MDEIQDFIITEMKAVYDRGDNSKSHGIWGNTYIYIFLYLWPCIFYTSWPLPYFFGQCLSIDLHVGFSAER